MWSRSVPDQAFGRTLGPIWSFLQVPSCWNATATSGRSVELSPAGQRDRQQVVLIRSRHRHRHRHHLPTCEQGKVTLEVVAPRSISRDTVDGERPTRPAITRPDRPRSGTSQWCPARPPHAARLRNDRRADAGAAVGSRSSDGGAAGSAAATPPATAPSRQSTPHPGTSCPAAPASRRQPHRTDTHPGLHQRFTIGLR